MEKIDFVITWVNGNDPKWIERKNEYLDDDKKIDARDVRYRDMDALKYWFRGVEKFANFVNNVYFVTDHQIPDWMNTDNSKIKIVYHEDYMKKENLPSFNSNAIENRIYKINGLSDKFVYFNDDMFILNKVKEEDFFIDGLPVDMMSLSKIKPISNNFHKKLINDIDIINKYFDFKKVIKENSKLYKSKKQGKYLLKTIPLLKENKFTGFRQHHMPVSYLKETFEKVWNIENEILEKTESFRFRNNEESVNHWLFEYWQFAEGKFRQRNANFGKYYSLADEKVNSAIEKQKYKIVCINDDNKEFNFEKRKKEVINSLEKILPEKCSFEK